MDYRVAIPSFKRSELIQKRTLPLLLNGKVSSSKIDIFVADSDEEKLYESSIPKEMYGRIINTKRTGISQTRNFIIDYYAERQKIVFIDDDVSKVIRKSKGKIAEIEDLDKFFRESFKKIEKYGVYLWTVKNMYNPFYKRQLKEEGNIGLIQFSGDLMGIINRHKMKIKTTLKTGEAEQVELLFRYYKEDGGILRFENVIVTSTKLTPGGKVASRGSVEARKRDIVPNLKALKSEFPDLVKQMVDTSKYQSRPKFDLVEMPVKKVEGGSSIVPKDEDSPQLLKLKTRPPFEKAKAKFIEEIEKVTIPKIKRSRYYPKGHPKEGQLHIVQRDLVIGTIGRTENFGFGKTRSGYKPFVANKNHPELFKAIIELGNTVVPKNWQYSAITLNVGVKAKKHLDTQNVGMSVIIAIGDFTDGGLYVFNPDGSNKTLVDIHDKPAMFNGAILPHQTQPFKGERYTLIFYNQKKGARIPGVRAVGKGDDIEELIGEGDCPCSGGVFA